MELDDNLLEDIRQNMTFSVSIEPFKILSILEEEIIHIFDIKYFYKLNQKCYETKYIFRGLRSNFSQEILQLIKEDLNANNR